jgi:hypothetical protein
LTVSPDALLSWAERYPELAPLFNPNGSEADFDSALERLIDDAVRWLEDNRNDLAGAKENLLSTTLAGKISMPGLRAIRERNINGHVDITIEIEHSYPHRRWLAEAKLWKGPQYHIDGMEQLMGYMNGRDRSGYVFDYVQEKDIEGKWCRLKRTLDKDMPLDQLQKVKDLPGSWTFETNHKHASGTSIRLVHYGINVEY